MNRENVEYMIKVMEDAQNLMMDHWQDWDSEESSRMTAARSIHELHSCGHTACLAGYAGISPKFIRDGGWIDMEEGAPYIRRGEDRETVYHGEEAIAYWLDIPLKLSRHLCGMNHTVNMTASKYYSKKITDIKPEDVIKKLNDILNSKELSFN